MNLAVDTNILVRLLVTDDRKQQQAALSRIQQLEAQEGIIIVPIVVIAELSWVLGAVYGYSRQHITRAIEMLMITAPFVLESRNHVNAALELYKTGSADFADYLILSAAKQLGADKLLTFDRHLLRLAYCERP